jgi:glycosyltransferase involved in cell wall biosynthesis
MAECARRSVLFSDSQVEVIPNAIDTDKYKPLNPCFARETLNLPEEANLVLFGALGLKDSPLKGLQLLREALGHLKNRVDVELVAVGEPGAANKWSLPFKTHSLGRLNDDATLALAYSAVDVVAVPSKVESFGLMAAESLACGTPCVGFSNTGIQDIIDHKRNGFLATPYNPVSFAEGIQWVLRQAPSKLEQSARSKAENNFSKEIVAQSYRSLYQDIVERK